MSQYNELSIEVYSSGTTLIEDPGQELRHAQGINFQSQYPGGLFGSASFFIPRNPLAWWELTGGQRVVIRNKQRLVYEGYISNLQSMIRVDGQGTLVNCIGAWGHILMNWMINKRWADTRVDEFTWANQITSGGAEEEFDISRTGNKIHFSPKDSSFTSGEYAAVRYVMPVGQTVKRITYSYDLVEATGSWEISVWRSTDGAAWTQMTNVSGESYTTGTTTVITATGSGSIDVTLGTPSRYLELRYYARGVNNPVAHDHNHGEFSVITVYSETGSINQEEIAKDIIGLVTDLNTSTMFIYAAGSPLSLVPFITAGYQSAADIIMDAAERGDAAYNRWAPFLQPSERATSPNGKPLLFLYQYIPTTSYEYEISSDDPNLIGGLSIVQDFDSIANDIIVSYTDQEGKAQYRTSDDLATLKDTTSITKYGKHTVLLNIGPSTSAIADNVGLRYLASYKNPPCRLDRPIMVQGYIKGNPKSWGGGITVPTSEIYSTLRVMINDYLTDITGSNQGLTFVITNTAYDQASETCTIQTGVPQAPMIPAYSHPVVVVVEPTGGGGGEGTRPLEKEDPGWNWYERYGNLEGVSTTGKWQNEPARIAWLKMSQAERNKWKKTTWKKSRRKGGRKGE